MFDVRCSSFFPNPVTCHLPPVTCRRTLVVQRQKYMAKWEIRFQRFALSFRPSALGVALLLGLALTTSARGSDQVTIEERQLSERNPTNYELSASIGDVQAAIKRAFGYEWIHELRLQSNSTAPKGPMYSALETRGASLLWKGEGDSLTKDILTKPGNEKDAYLWGGGRCVGLSQVYFKDGQPLIYFADFHIHLTSINASKTGVTVFTIDPNVVTGLEWHVAHGPAHVCVEVPPTSIEEYQILTSIGRQLHTRDMAEIKVPSPDALTSKTQRPRQR
jgi:hypothetical protein